MTFALSQRSGPSVACATLADYVGKTSNRGRQREFGRMSSPGVGMEIIMAACPKCGKHIKKRKGKGKCRKCGPLPDIALEGSKPKNPLGSCFDAAAWNLVLNDGPEFTEAIMCHGVGIANMPGQEGQKIAHAWIEIIHPNHGKVAIDPIWLIAQPASLYRGNLCAELVIEYKRSEFMDLWRAYNYPGPFDERVLQYTKEGKAKKYGDA